MEKLVFKDGQVEYLSPGFIKAQESVVQSMSEFAAELPENKCPGENAKDFLSFLGMVRSTYENIDWSQSRAERMRVVMDRALEAATLIEGRIASDTRVLN